jgi:DNA-binding NtrC family response regulator
VVDDVPELAALYTVLLELAGCAVMAFTDRADALAALGADAAKPDLLITDYLNSSMPVDPFLENCRLFHPELRILMISGVGGRDASFARVRPDRFLAKPFAGDRFQKEVHAALLG